MLDPILWSLAVKYSCFQLDTPSGKQINRIGDAYVDDTSLMKTATEEDFNSAASALQLTKEMEAISQNFERKLFSTGGSLNLKKCFWYLISWRWGKYCTATMVSKDQSEAEIKMTQGYKILEKSTIRREACDIAQRTLGCWLNPAGKMTHKDPKVATEYTIRLGQAQDWATAIINSNLNRKETYIAYHGVLQAKIGYALAVKTFTEPQLRKIQRTVDVTYRPKIGLNRNFPNAVVQGPTQYCGLA